MINPLLYSRPSNKLRLKNGLFLTLLLLSGSPVIAQQSNETLAKYLNQVRLNSTHKIPEELLLEKNAEEIINLSLPYFTDTTSAVRAKIYYLIGKIGIQSSRIIIRQSAVNQLLLGSRETNPSNVGLLWSILSQFDKNDFANTTKDTLQMVFRRKPLQMDKLLRLVGFLEMKELAEEIRPLTFAPNSKKDRWAALISLSRMGDTEATQSVVQRSMKVKINDDAIYELFPDLIYTRQHEVFDYIITILNSDDKNCLTADAENETPVLCGYRIMEQLAPVIEGYPLQLDSSGDINTKDYPKALAEVRKWFRQKGKQYRINRESI